MNQSIRYFTESPVERGVEETFGYTFSLSNWPTGTYSSPSVEIKDQNGRSLPAALTGSASITDGVFSTPTFVAGQLKAGQTYRMECKWSVDGEVYEAVCEIEVTL